MTQMKIKGVGRLRVNLKRDGRFHRTVRRMVKTNGVLSGIDLATEMNIDNDTIMHIMGEVVRIVRAGYEVRFGCEESGVRFYPILNKDCDKMILVAQTIGSFRNTVSDLKFDLYRGGEEITERETENFQKAVEKKFVSLADCVTPDMMVNCPKCGYEFRVGKKQAQC